MISKNTREGTLIFCDHHKYIIDKIHKNYVELRAVHRIKYINICAIEAKSGLSTYWKRITIENEPEYFV